jgi:uncharacterized protein YcaQ
VAADLPLLESVAAGEVPESWRPLPGEPEAVLLGPLDIVHARGRARSLFGFDHTWEVYKKTSQRTWGYYVVPVLFGDRIVARIEPIAEVGRRSLTVRRLWWEPGVEPTSLVTPLARGLARTARGLGLGKVRLGRVGPADFRDGFRRELRGQLDGTPG